MKRFIVVLAALAAALTAASATSAVASGAACGAPAAGGSYVGSMSVNAANPAGSTFALPAAGQYTVVVCGTWNNLGHNLADAEYTSQDNWATYAQGYDHSDYQLGPEFADLEVNNAFVNWGAYNASHTYSLSGSYSGALSLSVFDGDSNQGPLAKVGGWYGDNAGSLSADIYRSLPSAADQCKNGGWQAYGIFKNQGDCVSFVATHGKNPPAGA